MVITIINEGILFLYNLKRRLTIFRGQSPLFWLVLSQPLFASIAKFKAAFNDFGHSHYQQYRPLNKEQLRDLIQMTPLMWL